MTVNFNNAKLQISAVSKRQFLNDMPQIIFCGRSNVGKSSMINCLLNRKALARTSAKPGKTATINFYNIDSKLYFVDLPGYGYAKVSFSEKQKWARFMNEYFESGGDKRLAVSVVDLRHEPSLLDRDMAQLLYDKKIPFIIAATKADKLSKTRAADNLNRLKNEFYDGFEVLAFSSETREGKDELLNKITDSLGE